MLTIADKFPEAGALSVVISNSPVDIAWAKFDAAALDLHRLYSIAEELDDPVASAALRRERAGEVAAHWREFLDLFTNSNGRPE